MAVLTCSEKEWDKVRPASVKKTGLSEAMNKALKLLPGGDPAKLTTPVDCSKASTAMFALRSVLSTALGAVGKAKDDKKGAAGKLKAWQGEAEEVHKGLAAREIGLIEAVVAPAMKKWAGPREDLEKKVQAITAEIRDADTNIGHAEQMRMEAVMAMVERAGTLRETGWEGVVVEDFRKDPAFGKAYKTWDEMVDVQIKATKKLEAADQQARQLKKLITMMRGEVEEGAKAAGTGLQLDSQAIREFKKFRVDALKFYEESAGQNAAKYATFAYIATPTASGEVRGKMLDQLEKSFAKIKKADAESYFESTFAKYGLNEKRLEKTVKDVERLGEIGGGIVKALRVAADSKELQKLGTIATSLTETNQRLVKGRNNMETIQALSKDVNKDAKAAIDESLKTVARITQEIGKAYAELS